MSAMSRRQAPFGFMRNFFFTKKKMCRDKRVDISKEEITVDIVTTDSSVPEGLPGNDAWSSIFVDLTTKGSTTYLIFVDRQTLYPEVFELGRRSLWKQTKVAFLDVFREHRTPKEILTPEKVFFRTGKFIKFIKQHGILQITRSEAEDGRKLAGVLARVKTLIQNSRFWHEELRKLRKNIVKSLLVTQDKYVQVDENLENVKYPLSDSNCEL